MKHQIMIFAVIVSALITFVRPGSVQAAGYYLDYSLRGSASCTKTRTIIPETFVYNVPGGGLPVTETYSVNGAVILSARGVLPLSGAGRGSGNAGFAFSAKSYPYTYTATFTYDFGAAGTYTDFFKLVCDNGHVVSVSVRNADGTGSSGGSGADPIFDDGRLNMDALETAAIYCMSDGSVRVYVPGSPLWTIAFDASPVEIAKVPAKPATNTLIKSGSGAFLYRLTSGELQINSTRDYVFIFKDCLH